MDNTVKNMRRELSLICASLFAYIVLSNVCSLVLRDLIPCEKGTVLDIFAMMFSYAVPMFLSIRILADNDFDFRLRNSKSALSGYTIPIICAIFIPIQLAAGYINDFLEGIGVYSVMPEGLGLPDTKLVAVLLFISQAMFPAVFEELLFRGAILQRLRKYGDLFAVVITSILFVILHATLASLPCIFVLAVLFAYIDIKCNSIFPSMMMHFINNGAALFLSWSAYTDLSVTALYAALYASIAGITIVGMGILNGSFKNINVRLDNKISPIASLTCIPYLAFIIFSAFLIIRVTEFTPI